MGDHDTQHAEVRRMIDAKSWGELHRHDQLFDAQELGDAFTGFHEGALTHEPTFKVERKVGYHYKDQRVPSWCAARARSRS